jgi:trimethylamine:corrinoid methyltransferase-like protein
MRDDPVDEARALAADLREVGIGGHFLARRSTRQGTRAGELWQPRLWQRGPVERQAGDGLVRAAREAALELLRTHEVPPFDDDVADEVDDVIERYARTVGAPDARVHWRAVEPLGAHQ